MFRGIQDQVVATVYEQEHEKIEEECASTGSGKNPNPLQRARTGQDWTGQRGGARSNPVCADRAGQDSARQSRAGETPTRRGRAAESSTSQARAGKDATRRFPANGHTTRKPGAGPNPVCAQRTAENGTGERPGAWRRPSLLGTGAPGGQAGLRGRLLQRLAARAHAPAQHRGRTLGGQPGGRHRPSRVPFRGGRPVGA